MTVRSNPLLRPSLAALAAAAVLSLGAAPAFAQTGTPSGATPATPATPPTTAADARADRKADARASEQTKSQVSRDGRRFVEKAASGSLAEVALGRLAQERGSHDAVKAFGTLMVKDHSQAYDKLKAIAASKGVEVPAEPPAAARKHADQMAKKQGAEFDRAYMKHMVDEHKEDVKAFEKASKSVKDPELKAFADETLPTLKDHLEQAKTTRDALKTDGRKVAASK